ncbi:Protein of unknown function [Cotesia congregata]|uniref:Uncharacterized protein n=1 Tax=Cotesia congregata TaxID=51543 RepID=A0A8J2HER9_COTCN|nr:Protein of unknown function [Cotesia congregata]
MTLSTPPTPIPVMVTAPDDLSRCSSGKNEVSCLMVLMTGHEPAKRDQRGLPTWILYKIIDDGRMAVSRTSWNDGPIGTRSEQSTHA